jgi:hypothetical protein
MNTKEARGHLLYALRRALRPVARWLIRTGIRFDEFADLARGVYVESAIRDMTCHPGIPTRERIAMVTGLSYREVNEQIDNEGRVPQVDPTQMDLAAEVLQKWHSTPEYAGPYGIPLELAFDTPKDRSFCSLVALIEPKANPRAVLAELIRAGALAKSGEQHFRAVTRSFMASGLASPAVIEHFGRTLSRLATTLEFNMDPRHVSDMRLDRRAIANRGLPSHLVPEFEDYARTRAADFLAELDNWLAPYTSDESSIGTRTDAGVQVFLYAESPFGDESLANLVGPSGSSNHE